MAQNRKSGAYDVSSTAPHATRHLRKNPLWPVLKLGAVLGIPFILLHLYGQPALRVKYTWNGNSHAPIFGRCDYYSAFDGWKILRPLPAVNNCPLIIFIPFDLQSITEGWWS